MEKNNNDDMFIYFTFSIYAFLFAAKPEDIFGFSIECDETGKPFMLYRKGWDKTFTVEINTILISTYETLYDALKSIVLELRDIELKSNVYKNAPTAPKIEHYIPLIAQVENNIMEGDTTSTSIFGNRLKYDNQKTVDDFLATHGYRVHQDGGNQINVDGRKAILFEKYVTEELKG